jgi:hypothetical protein
MLPRLAAANRPATGKPPEICMATSRASEENGTMVAARKAVRNRPM